METGGSVPGMEMANRRPTPIVRGRKHFSLGESKQSSTIVSKRQWASCVKRPN